MKFQRDSSAPWRHIPRLLISLLKCVWKQGALPRIGAADALRGVGASRISLSLLATIDEGALEPGQLARFRLVRATALQYVGSHREALELFEVSERNAPNELFLSFVLQHHGKCLVEVGNLELARSKLKKALELRRASGQPELVASSQRALEAVGQMR